MRLQSVLVSPNCCTLGGFQGAVRGAVRGFIRQNQSIRNFRIEIDKSIKASVIMPGHETDFRMNEIHVHTSSNGESLAMTYYFNGEKRLEAGNCR